jgi:hypothetical protein
MNFQDSDVESGFKRALAEAQGRLKPQEGPAIRPDRRPRGRPLKMLTLFQKQLALDNLQAGKDALEFLKAVMYDQTQELKWRIAAATELHDRIFGKPVQAVRRTEKEEFRQILEEIRGQKQGALVPGDTVQASGGGDSDTRSDIEPDTC